MAWVTRRAMGRSSWLPLRQTLNRPARGILEGLGGFCLFLGLAEIARWVFPGGMFSPPFPSFAGAGLSGWEVAAVGGGGALEEWIFRVIFLLGWVGTAFPQGNPPRLKPPIWRTKPAILIWSSLYFAGLHLPQGLGQSGLAGAGGMVLGGVLLWRKNYWTAATAHLLFNIWLGLGVH